MANTARVAVARTAIVLGSIEAQNQGMYSQLVSNIARANFSRQPMGEKKRSAK